MPKTLIICAVLVLLSACSTTWNHPSKGNSEFAQDDYACRRDAYATGGAVFVAGVASPTPNRAMYRRCMESKGYTAE
jgi:hypothetical protein